MIALSKLARTISDEIQEITEGRRIFKRFSQEEQSGFRRGGKIYAGAAAVQESEARSNSPAQEATQSRIIRNCAASKKVVQPTQKHLPP